MFSSKDLKVKLVYMGVGGMIAIIGMLFGIGMVSSSTAQRDKFGEIECTSLRVVDVDGKERVILTTGKHGGFVYVTGKERNSSVSLSFDRRGGNVHVAGKEVKLGAQLGINKYGGFVQVTGKSEGQAIMGISEYGNGAVSTWDKNGYRQ